MFQKIVLDGLPKIQKKLFEPLMPLFHLRDQRRDHAKAGLIIHFIVIVHSLPNLSLYNLHDQEVASLSHLPLPDNR